MALFTIRNLNFAYPEQEKNAISDLSLSVQPGEFLVLCGPSGCGKSTLLRQLKTVLAPHGRRSGEILFDGKNLDELSQREQAEKIGFVQQSPENQIATDKVWHELAFGLESLGYDIERRLEQLDEQFQRLLAEAIDAEDKEACNAQFAEILTEQTALKKQKKEILQNSADADRVCTRMKQAEQALDAVASTLTEWNETAVRQTVERVTVLSADEVLVRIKGGAEIKQRLEGK